MMELKAFHLKSLCSEFSAILLFPHTTLAKNPEKACA